MEPGMHLAIPRILPDAKENAEQIDLLAAFAVNDHGLYVENVREYVVEAVKVLGIKTVEKILGVSHRSLVEEFRHASMSARVSKLNSLAERTRLKLDPSRLRIRTKNYRSGSIPASIPVSRDLMLFLGYWVAEGMFGAGVKIYSLDETVRKEIGRIAREIFGLNVRYHRQDKTRIDIGSLALEMVLRHVLSLEGGAGNKEIPSVVLGQTNDFLAAFLRAYYTGDGSVGTSVEATTKSKSLASQLQYALSRFGIVARVAEKVVHGTVYYRVAIYGRKDIQRFEQSIGFLNRSNQERLAAYIGRDSRLHTNVDVIPGIATLLKKCLQFKSGSEQKEIRAYWHTYWLTEKRIGPSTLLSFVQATGVQGDLRENLLRLAYSDIFWDEVVEVKEVHCNDKYVYDLEVPGAENFVGGNGGVFLHNTTSINCLALFIRPEAKIVTIEDTPEINLAHVNWIQSVSRQGVSGIGEVTLYDLLRAALRQRPDFIIVGEVRGEEAQTLFQALSTGHSGMSSIHADSISAVLHRLTNPPMNIPRTLIPAVNFILQQGRMIIKNAPARRVVSVAEVVGVDTRTNELITNEVYSFNAETGALEYTGRSYTLEKFARAKGTSYEDLKREIATRAHIIEWMVLANMRKYREVASVIQRYYTDRAGLLAEIGAIGV